MPTVNAALGVSIDPTDAQRGGAEVEQTLNRLTTSADKAQSALNNVTRGLSQGLGNTERAAQAINNVMQTLNTHAASSSDTIARNIVRVQQSIDQIQRQAVAQLRDLTSQAIVDPAQTNAVRTAYSAVIRDLRQQLAQFSSEAERRFQQFQQQGTAAAGATGEQMAAKLEAEFDRIFGAGVFQKVQARQVRDTSSVQALQQEADDYRQIQEAARAAGAIVTQSNNASATSANNAATATANYARQQQTWQQAVSRFGGGGGGMPPGGGPVPPIIPPGGGGGGGGGNPPIPPPTNVNTLTNAIRNLKTEQTDASLAARLHAQQLLRVNQIEPTGMLRFAESLRINGALLGNFGSLMGPMAGHVLRFADAAALSGVAMDRFANGVGQNSLKLRELTPLVEKQGVAMLALETAQNEARLAQDALTALQANGAANVIQLAAAHERAEVTAKNLTRAERDAAAATTAVNAAARSAAGGLTAILAAAVPLIAILAAIAAAVTGIIVAYKALKDAIGAGAEWQTLHDRMTTIVGDAQQARVMLMQLRDLRLGQEFTLPELADVAKNLIGVGVTGRDVVGIMQGLATASVITGSKVGAISQTFIEVQKQGRVTMDQLVQLKESGFDLFGELERVTGRSGLALAAFANAGLISSRQLQDAWRAATTERGRYARVLENEAKSLAGVWRTLKQQWTDALQDIGNPIAPALTGVIKLFTDWRNGLIGNFRGIGEQIANFIREGTTAAREGNFGVWFGDQLKQAATAFGSVLTRVVSDAAETFLAAIITGLENRIAAAFKRAISTDTAPSPKEEMFTMADNFWQSWKDLGTNTLRGWNWFMSTAGQPTGALSGRGPTAGNPFGNQYAGTTVGAIGAFGGAVGPSGLDEIREMSTSMSYARNSITDFGKNIDLVNNSLTTLSKSTQTTEQAIRSVSGTPKWFGLNKDWSVDITDVGRMATPHQGAFQGTSLTNPNLAGVAIGGQQAMDLTGIKDAATAQTALMGQWVQITNKLDPTIQTFARIVDKGPFGQVGIEATPLVHQRLRADETTPLQMALVPNQFAAIAQAAAARAPGPMGSPAGGFSAEAAVRLLPGTDRAAIGEMVLQWRMLNEQQSRGVISMDEFNRKLAELRAKTVAGLIDPKSADALARSYGVALDDVVSKHALAMAEIERRQAEMDLKIKTNDVGAMDAFVNGWQKASIQYRNSALQMQQLGGQIFDVIGNGVSTAFGAIVTGTKSAKDAFREMAVSMLQQIAQLIIKMLVFRALSTIFGGTGIFGGGSTQAVGSAIVPSGGFIPVGHTGMIIPRYHSGGLAPNERLIVGLSGEGIFTERQMSHLIPTRRDVFTSDQLSALHRMHDGGVIGPDIPASLRRQLARQDGGDRRSVVSQVTTQHQENSFHTEIHIHQDGTATSRTATSGGADQAAMGRRIDSRVREVLADEMRNNGLVAKFARRE